MITRMTDVPGNMVAFTASGKITRDDYELVVMPAVSEMVGKTGMLNYLMMVDTTPGNFTVGTWLQDLVLGIKEITKWNRAAIVTNAENIDRYATIFSVIEPAAFRGYTKEQLAEAIQWVATGE